MGVGLGVAAIIVVLSVMDGFEGELKKRLMSSDLHILVEPTEQVEGFEQGMMPIGSFRKTQGAALLANDDRVLDAFPVLATEAILRSGRRVTGIILKGVGEARMKRLGAQLAETAEPQMLSVRQGQERIRIAGVFVGRELAYEMGIIPGDYVTLISPTETSGPVGGVPRLKRFVVEGVYASGFPDQELHTVFTPVRNVRSFLRKKNVLSHWEVTLRQFEDAPRIASNLRSASPEFRVQDWVQMNASLFASLRLERLAMFVILAVIVVVASFNIVTTLTLMVLEKRAEISILKAMGARHVQLAAVFLAEGLLIGGLGAGGGGVLAFVLCGLLKRYEFIALPEVYVDRTLPVAFNPLYYLAVGVLAFVIVLLACVYPAKRAARMGVLEGIRH